MNMMIMDMSFYWGNDVVFLFSNWQSADNAGLYLLFVFTSFALGVLLEFLKSR